MLLLADVDEFSFANAVFQNQAIIWTDSDSLLIRSSDNDSTCFWPLGSMHTLGADGHI